MTLSATKLQPRGHIQRSKCQFSVVNFRFTMTVLLLRGFQHDWIDKQGKLRSNEFKMDTKLENGPEIE